MMSTLAMRRVEARRRRAIAVKAKLDSEAKYWHNTGATLRSIAAVSSRLSDETFDQEMGRATKLEVALLNRQLAMSREMPSKWRLVERFPQVPKITA